MIRHAPCPSELRVNPETQSCWHWCLQVKHFSPKHLNIPICISLASKNIMSKAASSVCEKVIFALVSFWKNIFQILLQKSDSDKWQISQLLAPATELYFPD